MFLFIYFIYFILFFILITHFIICICIHLFVHLCARLFVFVLFCSFIVLSLNHHQLACFPPVVRQDTTIPSASRCCYTWCIVTASFHAAIVTATFHAAYVLLRNSASYLLQREL
jgi:hypothetical protein